MDAVDILIPIAICVVLPVTIVWIVSRVRQNETNRKAEIMLHEMLTAPELPLDVKIVPHCAFGAGHHETTSLIVDTLLSTDLSGKIVLDHGTGTGVLAIFAKRKGASEVVAVDIDEKSVENAKENAALNGEKIDVRLGDTVPEGTYDFILANIHRNVLLSNMSAYAEHLSPNGELWISGFYEADCAPLKEAAESQGLTFIQVLSRGEWQLMRYRK